MNETTEDGQLEDGTQYDAQLAPGPHFIPYQLADRWNTKTGTLDQYRHEGTGPPFIKVKGMVRYPRAWIYAYELRNAHLLPDDLREKYEQAAEVFPD